MFSNLGPYEAMQSASLPWSPRIPAHWSAKRSKTVMHGVDVRSKSGSEELLTVSSNRGVVRRSTATVSMFQAESYIGHKLCWPGDLVINSLWAWSKGLGVARDHGIVSTAYGVYRTRPDAPLDPSYLHHLVRSTPFQWELQVRSQGIWKSRLQITDARWLDAPLLLPPLNEQAAVVKYLAHANARIDIAIASKRRLIALLEEQRLEMIARLVGGADGERLRLKNCATLQTGLTLGKDYRQQGLIEYPYLRVANVQMGRVDIADLATLAVPRDEAERRRLRSGDVLMTEGGDIDKLGRGTVWGGEVEPCLHQNHVFAVRCGDRLLPEFLAAWLAAPEARDYFYSTAKKTTNLASTNSTVVRELPISVPPIDIQRRLLDRLAASSHPFTEAAAWADREINLLREFRTRLVGDVVTGQLDVREVSASLSDVDHAAAGGRCDDPADSDLAASIDEVTEASED
jgi:type I restriction enzyme, S subunit